MNTNPTISPKSLDDQQQQHSSINNKLYRRKKYVDVLLWFAVSVAIGSIASWSIMQDDHSVSIHNLQSELTNRKDEHTDMSHELKDVLTLSNLIAERCLCEHKVIECDMNVVNNNLKKIFNHVNENHSK